jgi:hypothetical protein
MPHAKFRIFRFALLTALALVALPLISVAQTVESKKVQVGDSVVSGLFIKPYTNLWKLVYTRPTGEAIDAATWSDEVERVQLNGRTVLKRTQVAKYKKNGITMTTVNIFDPATMAPIMRDFKGSQGLVKHVEFDGKSIKYRGNAAPGGETSEGTAELDVPVFDFYGGLWGLLLATFPLKAGFTASLPSLDESTETLRWATFKVTRREMVEAGAGKQVKAWVVETNDNGPMTFWLTKKAPYVIKLVYVTPQGITATYSMI